MITLTNPLTTKERLSVVRLLGHDSQNQIAMISSNLRAYEIIAKNPRRDNTRILPYDVLKALAIHVSHTQQTVRDLVQFKKIYLHKTDLSSLINNLVTSFKEWGGNLEYDLNPNIGEIHLEENILHSILFNLANNGFNNQEVPRNERKVNLTVIPCELPKEAVYVSEGASDYSQFVGFHFQNTGREFPKDKPLIERLTICPSEMKGGFGLYFTGLATKVLRGCVDIKSEGEDTTVSFYQPIYPDEQARGGNKT